jgi:hypothetical protein
MGCNRASFLMNKPHARRASGTVTGMHKSPDSTNGETESGPNHNSWRKSSKSMSDGHCVEVARSSQYVLMRDSKDVAGSELAFDTNAWNSFVKEIKAGGKE